VLEGMMEAAEELAENMNRLDDEVVPGALIEPLGDLVEAHTSRAVALSGGVLVYRINARWRAVELVPSEPGKGCGWCRALEPTTRGRCTACLDVLEEVEATTGGNRPYGYTTVPALGGKCIVCERSDGGHGQIEEEL